MGSENNWLTSEGQSVELSATGYDFSYRWHSTVRVAPADPLEGLPADSDVNEFHISSRGNFDLVVERALGGEVVERLSMQGGELCLARGQTQGMVFWRGEWHEMGRYLQYPSIPMDQALRLFEGLAIEDTADGLRVMSRDGTLKVETLDVWKWIPGVGGAIIESPKRSLTAVPSWQGMETPAGEVWRVGSQGDKDGEIPALVLGTATCAMRLEPDRASGDTDAGLRFVSSISTIRWA